MPTMGQYRQYLSLCVISYYSHSVYYYQSYYAHKLIFNIPFVIIHVFSMAVPRTYRSRIVAQQIVCSYLELQSPPYLKINK